jgi:pimeloyl-ACP methyl ester carboxylesterase
MGGKIAQFVAADRPAQLRKLVLVAHGTAHAYALNEKHRAMAEAAFGSRLRIERFQAAAMRRAVEPAVMERLVSDALIAQREAWFGWYDRGRAVDFADRLAEIPIPTIVVSERRTQPPDRDARRVGRDHRPGRLICTRVKRAYTSGSDDCL